jgi:hypothetical protein
MGVRWGAAASEVLLFRCRTTLNAKKAAASGGPTHHCHDLPSQHTLICMHDITTRVHNNHDQCAINVEVDPKGNIIHAFASLNKLGKWLYSLPKLASDARQTDVFVSKVIVQKARAPCPSLLLVIVVWVGVRFVVKFARHRRLVFTLIDQVVVRRRCSRY